MDINRINSAQQYFKDDTASEKPVTEQSEKVSSSSSSDVNLSHESKKLSKIIEEIDTQLYLDHQKISELKSQIASGIYPGISNNHSNFFEEVASSIIDFETELHKE